MHRRFATTFKKVAIISQISLISIQRIACRATLCRDHIEEETRERIGENEKVCVSHKFNPKTDTSKS